MEYFKQFTGLDQSFLKYETIVGTGIEILCDPSHTLQFKYHRKSQYLWIENFSYKSRF